MIFQTDGTKTWLENENGKQVALLNHPEIQAGVVNFTHTEVDSSLQGQGIAGKITQFAAEKLREDGRKAILTCSYSIKWFAKHPEYADVLLDPAEEERKAEELAGPACGI